MYISNIKCDNFFYIDYVYNRHEKIMNADLDVSNQNTTYFNFVRKKKCIENFKYFYIL